VGGIPVLLLCHYISSVYNVLYRMLPLANCGEFRVGEMEYSSHLSANVSFHKIRLSAIGLMQRSNYVRNVCARLGRRRSCLFR
jgi:hypothetical protein